MTDQQFLLIIGVITVILIVLVVLYVTSQRPWAPGARKPDPWHFNVLRYGAVGDGVNDDTAAIQAAIAEAQKYMLEHNTAAEVFLPPGKYRVSQTLRVTENGITLRGVGTTGDSWTTKATCLVPDADFADNTYVVSFDWYGKDKSLFNCAMDHINIIQSDVTPFTNWVHGIFWGVTKGVMNHCHVENMSGRGLGVAGHSSMWRAQDNYFLYSSFRYCGTHGIEILKSESDNWWHMCKSEGNIYGSGLCGIGANDYFDCCHFTGNLNNVSAPTGGVEPAFIACNFETPSQHNVLFDVTGGGISRARFIGCQFNANRLESDNTWDNLHITRISGSYQCSGIITGCTITAQTEDGGANKPRYHINLGAGAYFFIVESNLFSGPAKTGNVNHSDKAQMCTVNGLGHNDGNPNEIGDWYGKGDEGLHVVDTRMQQVYAYANGAWLA